MKFRKTVSSIIISAILVLAAALCVVHFRVASTGMERVKTYFMNFLPQGSGTVEVRIGEVSDTLMRSLKVSGITVNVGGRETVTISRAELSLNLWQLLRIALGKDISSVTASVSGIRVSVDDSTLETLSEFAASRGESGETAEKGISSRSLAVPALDIILSDISVDADVRGIQTSFSDVYAYARFGSGLSFEEAGLNIPSLPVSYPKLLGDTPVVADDIRLYLDSSMDYSLSIQSITSEGTAKAGGISAVARISKDLITAALYLENLDFDGTRYGYPGRGEASSLYVGVNYDRTAPSVEFDFSAEKLSGTGTVGGYDVFSSVDDASAFGKYDMGDSLSLSLYAENLGSDIKGPENGMNVSLSELFADIGVNLGAKASNGQITVMDARYSGDAVAAARSAALENLVLDYSYSPQSVGLRARGKAAAETEMELLGNVSGNFDISVQGKGIKSLDSISVALDRLSAASIDGVSAELSMQKDSDISANVFVGDELSASLVLSRPENRLSLQLYLTDLVPARHGMLFEKFLSGQKFITENTALDGSLLLAVNASDVPFDFGKISESGISIDEIRSLIGSGRISLNGAVRNIRVGDSEMGGAATLEASFDSEGAQVDSLAVTAMGYRVSYNGSVDFRELVPSGTLVLQSAADGKELASVDLSHASGSMTYEYSVKSPLVSDVSLHGVIDWQDLSAILISGRLETPVLIDNGISFDAVFNPNPLKLSLRSAQADLDISYSGSMADVTGSLRNLGINAGDMPISISSALAVKINTETRDFDVVLKGLDIVARRFRFGCNLHLTPNRLQVEELALGLGSRYSHFTGTLDLSFGDFRELAAGNTSSILGTVDFISSDALTAFSGAVTQDRGYLEISMLGNEQFQTGISILGRRGHPFYFTGSLSWGDNGANALEFNGVYDDMVFRLYESKGRIGSLELNDMSLTADFAHNKIDGSVALRNEKTFMDGNTRVQSVVFDFGASTDSFLGAARNMLAGRPYHMDFTAGLSDFRLEDGFKVPDTNLSISLNDDIMELEGNMINGVIDLTRGYVDISIEEGFLFGFKAEGYIGDTLDLYLSDIHFPLTLAGQFIDMPMLSFDKGEIEGDVLLKRTSSGLSFYGMLYCHSFDMNMFFLPGEVITAKNLAIALHDHTVSISNAPLSGYSEDDGRYFNGDFSAEIVILDSGVESMEIGMNINDRTPLHFWFPMKNDQLEMEIRSDVSGFLGFALSGGKARVTTDIKVSDMLMDFRIDDELPSWLPNMLSGRRGQKLAMDLDVRLTTGQNVEFYYPEKDNSFINFTLSEDKSVHLVTEDGKMSMEGGLSLKTGQVYYFQNDFIIREGSVDLTERRYTGTTSSFPFVLNLVAEMTDYDSDGNKVEISLILKNSTPDNISPRFSSVPAMSENEIMAMLGQSVLSAGALDQSVSISSLATLAATATDALTRVGILESNKNYSITGTVRNALGLDIFSARSNIISNVIIDALPGEITGRGDVSVLARYLDGTSLYAGKYIGNDLFVKIRIMLKADGRVKLSDRVGHFLAKDLILDNEISLDLNTPLGTFSVFTQPRELSVFDILDTIGFSVTKQIQF